MEMTISVVNMIGIHAFCTCMCFIFFFDAFWTGLQYWRTV